MDMDILFKIAAIGIVVSVINIILNKAGREEQAMLVTLAGVIIVLVMIVNEISSLFNTIKTIFNY